MRLRANARYADSEFDRKWGVSTSGTFIPGKSEVIGSNWFHGVEYQGIGASAVYDALSGLGIPYEEFTFIDFGSGKGRALLTACRFPFKSIIGVEYSEHLNETARRNVSCFPETDRKCESIQIVCADAATFPIPQGPLVIFLYNPFGRPVMQNVVDNLLVSFQGKPRRIIVLYFNAVFIDVWKNAGFLHEIQVRNSDVILDTQA